MKNKVQKKLERDQFNESMNKWIYIGSVLFILISILYFIVGYIEDRYIFTQPEPIKIDFEADISGYNIR